MFIILFLFTRFANKKRKLTYYLKFKIDFIYFRNLTSLLSLTSLYAIAWKQNMHFLTKVHKKCIKLVFGKSFLFNYFQKTECVCI